MKRLSSTTATSQQSAAPAANTGHSSGVSRPAASAAAQSAVASSTSAMRTQPSAGVGKRKSADIVTHQPKKNKLDKKFNQYLKQKDSSAVKPLMDVVIPKTTGAMYYPVEYAL